MARGREAMVTHYSFASGEGATKRGALIELVREVKELMQHGWQPLGAPFYLEREYHRDGSMDVFCQALVKTTQSTPIATQSET